MATDSASTPRPTTKSTAEQRSPGPIVAVRVLRPGDRIRDDGYLAGNATVSSVTVELGRDLRPWYAIRLEGGGIRGVDDLDATVELLAATPPRETAAIQEGEFTAPTSMAGLLELAQRHRRDYRVAHHTDNGGHPLVSLALGWFPPGCDVPTRVELTWHTRDTGTYRLFTASASGFHRGHHRVTVTTARALVTGDRCFHRDHGQR